jgi:hypothetical protein
LLSAYIEQMLPLHQNQEVKYIMSEAAIAKKAAIVDEVTTEKLSAAASAVSR